MHEPVGLAFRDVSGFGLVEIVCLDVRAPEIAAGEVGAVSAIRPVLKNAVLVVDARQHAIHRRIQNCQQFELRFAEAVRKVRSVHVHHARSVSGAAIDQNEAVAADEVLAPDPERQLPREQLTDVQVSVLEDDLVEVGHLPELLVRLLRQAGEEIDIPGERDVRPDPRAIPDLLALVVLGIAVIEDVVPVLVADALLEPEFEPSRFLLRGSD